MIERSRMFASYNSWANERIYEAAVRLSDADYRADRGAFFGSLHGTLNHLLVGDRIWMHRFTGSGDAPNKLDAILFEKLSDLHEARRAEDLRISRYCESLDDKSLMGEFTYRTIARPATITQKLGPALDHFFNHQTHHRGQAHCILSAIAGREAAPSLDLILFQRETEFDGIKQQV